MKAKEADGAHALEAREVCLRYTKTGPLAVDRVSVAIPDGVSLGIVGESGSGKSSLARILVGERPPTSGEALVFGTSWRHVKPCGSQRRAVQMVFQDPYTALNPFYTALATVTEAVALAGNRRRKGQAEKMALEILREVGLSDDDVSKRPRRLSGGQRQRVAIARALGCEPSVLVADEPTASLDLSVQAQILTLLTRLRRERSLTLVLISHDIAIVNYATDEVVVMLQGRVVEAGATADVIAHPTDPYTQRLVDAYATTHA